MQFTSRAGEFFNNSNQFKIRVIARCWKVLWLISTPSSHAWAKSMVWFTLNACDV